MDAELERVRERASGEVKAMAGRLEFESGKRAMLEGRTQELSQAGDAAREELEALRGQMAEAGEAARVEIERTKHLLEEARKAIKPRAARKIAAAEDVARQERERNHELQQQLDEARNRLLVEVASRVSGEEALASSGERLEEAEAAVARERDELQAMHRRVEELSAAEQAARIAAEAADERLAQARNALCQGTPAD